MPALISPACRSGESRRADLWRGCASLWAPCLRRFSLGTSFSTRDQAVPDLGFLRQGIRRSGGGAVGVNRYGYAIALNGVGGGFIVANGSLSNYDFIHQTGVFSLALLIRTDTTSVFSVLFDSILGSSAATGISVYMDNSGKINCAVCRSSAGNFVVTGSAATALSAGAWTPLAITCDGTTQRIWTSGKRNGADAAVGTLGSGDASQALGLGCYGGGVNTNVWAGQIAYAGIWNRALSSRDVRALAADPLCMFRRRHPMLGHSAGFRSWFAHHAALVGGGI